MSREFDNKEQIARNELENFNRRSKLLERDQRVSKETRDNEQTSRKELESFRRRSKTLERD